jgi:hypothetical protein
LTGITDSLQAASNQSLLTPFMYYVCFNFSYILAPLGTDGNDVKPTGIVAEKDSAAGKVSQCHIDRPPPTSPLLQNLIAGGRAVINIPHKVMRAQAIAVAAANNSNSELSDRSRHRFSEDEVIASVRSASSSSSVPIPSGSPRNMRTLNRAASRSFRAAEGSSAIVPEESSSYADSEIRQPSYNGDVEAGRSVRSMVSASEISVRNMRSMSRGTLKATERSGAVMPVDAQTADRGDESEEGMVSTLEALLKEQYSRLGNNEETKRNFENRWE